MLFRSVTGLTGIAASKLNALTASSRTLLALPDERPVEVGAPEATGEAQGNGNDTTHGADGHGPVHGSGNGTPASVGTGTQSGN